MRKPHLYRLSLLLCSLFISACDTQPEPSVSNLAETLIRPAKLQSVGVNDNDIYLNYPATITATNLNELSFEVGGVVKEVFVVEAQEVTKGDVLAKLDSRDLLAKLSSAQAKYDNTNTEFERALRLMKEDAISKSELDKRRSDNNVNKAALDSALKAVQDVNLVAPYSGNIAEIFINTQQAVSAGETAIKVLGNGLMEASMNLPASIMAKALKNDHAGDSAYLLFSFASETKIPVDFKEANLNADSTSQTYRITFTFTPPKTLNILPGMNASIWFKKPTNSTVNSSQVSVPLTAIAVEGKQKFVWVVDQKSMQVSKREITIEYGVGESLLVKSGLTKGETIVISGVSSLSSGMKVRPWSK